jgi:hypothetical protein
MHTRVRIYSRRGVRWDSRPAFSTTISNSGRTLEHRFPVVQRHPLHPVHPVRIGIHSAEGSYAQSLDYRSYVRLSVRYVVDAMA